MATWCFHHFALRTTDKKFTLRSMPASRETPLVLFIPETLMFELVSCYNLGILALNTMEVFAISLGSVHWSDIDL